MRGGESLLPDPFYITHWTLALPPTPSVNIAASVSPTQWTKNASIAFQNPQGFGTNNKVSAFQWAWTTSRTHIFTGVEAQWSTGSLVRNIAASGSYVLHIRSINYAGLPTAPRLEYGPFLFDLEPPEAPGTPQGMIPSLPNIRFDWTAAGDAGRSEVASYECQIGTTPGGSNVFNGSVGSTLTKTVTGVSGSTYYARVRAMDGAGNVGPWSANSAGVPYTNQVGSLKVSLSPPIAVISGGAWRRMGMSTWLASNAVETSVPVGMQTVEFRDLNGYMEPAPKRITVVAGNQANTSGTYTMCGTLQVVISPAEAVAGGAQWRYYQLAKYPSSWQNSGAVVEVAASPVFYNVEFKDIPNWAVPPLSGVSVPSMGSSAVVSGGPATYTKDKGAIRIAIHPAEAVMAGAQWRRTGTTAWLNSGAT